MGDDRFVKRKERKEGAKAKMQRDKIAVAMGRRGERDEGGERRKEEKRERGRGSEKTKR